MAELPGDGGGRLGRFRLDRILGTGGFATVWLAYDETLDASVAIKVLAENWSHNEEIRNRFTEEARILWRMESAHIVRVYGVDSTPDGRPYFVMEYADGGSLEDQMRQRHDAGQAYSIGESISIGIAIADGLVDAQNSGIVHRDLKPSNVIFKTTPSGGPRLLLADFGIARSLEAVGVTTIAAGTPHYMAPEQSEGRADRASDVYSAAVILFELLAGRVPFPYKSAGQVIRAQISERAPDITTLRTDVPEILGIVVARGLTADPTERQESALEWRRDLERASRAEETPPLAAATGNDAGATLGPEDLALLGAGAVAGAAAGAAAPPDVPAPPPVPPRPPAGPAGAASGSPGRVPNRRRRRIVAAVAAFVVLVGLLTGIALASSGTANAEVFRVPATVVGAHPFTPSVAAPKVAQLALAFLKPPSKTFAAPPTAVAGSIPSFQGNTPGLYGGTRQLSVCDPGSLTSFLESNPQKAAAWAGVEGISPSDIGSYVGGLTDVILRADTRVTNHGFVNGAATTIPEVLQAGTAVLVDNLGVPRARCYCGNPLTEPVALSNIHYGGPSWPGFSPTKEAVVAPGPPVTKLVIVDAQNGIPFVRPTGTNGPDDTDAPVGVLAGSPFAPSAPSGSTAVDAPPTPSAVPGTYTLNNTTDSSGCTASPSVAGATFPVTLKGNTITLALPGEALSGPYDRSAGYFDISQAAGVAVGNPGTSALTGSFVNGPQRSVRLVLLLAGGTNCTVTFAATKPGPNSSAPTTTTTVPATIPPTTAAQPVDVSSQGTVSASSTYSSQYPASAAIDGNPGTSWFSAGASDGPNSTFTWQGKTDQLITTISITGNEDNSIPANRSGYGYAQTEIQVLNSAGTVVFDHTYPGPGDAANDITASPNAVGETVRLILMNRESPDCGGFGELKIEAVP